MQKQIGIIIVKFCKISAQNIKDYHRAAVNLSC